MLMMETLGGMAAAAGYGRPSFDAAARPSFEGVQRPSFDPSRGPSFDVTRQSFGDQPRTSFEQNTSDAPRKLAILGLPWDTRCGCARAT
jgi:hypothetical protein